MCDAAREARLQTSAANGCGVKGRPLAHARHELADGDVARIGHVELRFRKRS